jgi:hypothetical protein
VPIPDDHQPSKPEGFITDLHYINNVLLPEWHKQFEDKNADYGDDSGKLGVKGGFTDLWRKVNKLKRAIWDGQELHGEQAREIAMDMIGHAFLLLVDLDGYQQRYEAWLDETKVQTSQVQDWDHA